MQVRIPTQLASNKNSIEGSIFQIIFNECSASDILTVYPKIDEELRHKFNVPRVGDLYLRGWLQIDLDNDLMKIVRGSSLGLYSVIDTFKQCMSNGIEVFSMSGLQLAIHMKDHCSSSVLIPVPVAPYGVFFLDSCDFFVTLNPVLSCDYRVIRKELVFPTDLCDLVTRYAVQKKIPSLALHIEYTVEPTECRDKLARNPVRLPYTQFPYVRFKKQKNQDVGLFLLPEEFYKRRIYQFVVVFETEDFQTPRHFRDVQRSFQDEAVFSTMELLVNGVSISNSKSVCHWLHLDRIRFGKPPNETLPISYTMTFESPPQLVFTEEDFKKMLKSQPTFSSPQPKLPKKSLNIPKMDNATFQIKWADKFVHDTMSIHIWAVQEMNLTYAQGSCFVGYF